MRPSLRLLSTLLAMAASLSAAEPNPKPTPAGKDTGLIPRRVLYGNPDKASPRISPDGKHLAYLAPVNGVLNVWVSSTDDVGSAKPITKDTKRGIRQYLWAYDSQTILYVQDSDGDENWHAFGINLKGGEAKDLTPLPKVAAQLEAISHRFPDEIVVGLNDRDPQYHDLYRLNVVTGQRTLLQKNEEFSGFTLDEDLKVRFAQKFSPDGGNLVLKPDGSGGWTEFLKIPMEDSLTTRVAGFDKTGTVAYLIDSRGRDTGAVTSIDLKTNQQTVIAQSELADASGVLSHPTENTVLAVSFTYDRTQWKFLDKEIEDDFRTLKAVADGEITVSSQTLDNKVWGVAFLMDAGSVRYFLYDREKKKAQFLFSSRPELDEWKLQPMRPEIITARDGLKLVSYLTLPPGTDPDGNGRPGKPVPLVLEVHGGPWARDEWGFEPSHQLYANRGYAVLSVNFRGSTGFGKKFLNAGNREWAARMHDDLLDAVKWAIDKKIADPKKVAIMGGSYGGYATLVGLTFTPDVFACGVDIVGPSNLVTLLKTIPPYWAPALQLFKDRVGDHLTEEGRKFLEERSPLSRVEHIKKPLLIGQGANDPRVKQAEADQIVKAMQDRKIPVTYVLFPDEGHGFARPENSLAFQAVAEAFLARHLGGRFETIGDAFTGSSVQVPTGAEDVPGLSTALPKTASRASQAK